MKCVLSHRLNRLLLFCLILNYYILFSQYFFTLCYIHSYCKHFNILCKLAGINKQNAYIDLSFLIFYQQELFAPYGICL